MHDMIKELLKQIPIKPVVIKSDSITFLNRLGDYLKISASDDNTTYAMQYRIDYKCGRFEAGTMNFFDVENRVVQFMA